jgi:hypothetical protein
MQKQLVERVVAARREIVRELATAERLERDIDANIEAMILGTTKVSAR